MATSLPAYGYEEAFGIAPEVTFGTPVSPSVWWRPVSCTLRANDPLIPLAQATGSSVQVRYSATQPNTFRSMQDVSGTVVLEAEYDDIGYLLNNAIAQEETPVDNTGADNGYEHTWEVDKVPSEMPQSFTAARLTGITGCHYRLKGCMINNLELSVAQGRIATVSMDIIGQTGDTDADTIGTLSAAPFIEYHHSYVRREDTVSSQPTADDDLDDEDAVTDWVFRVENNLRVQQAAGYGARGCRPMIYSAYRRFTLTFSKDFYDSTFYTVHSSSTMPGTFDAVSVYCDSGVDIDVGGQNYDLEIYFPAASLMERNDEYGGGGEVIPESITYEAAVDGSDDICQVIINNNTASYPAAT